MSSHYDELSDNPYYKVSIKSNILFNIEELKEVFYEERYKIDTLPSENVKNERSINFSYEPTPYSFLEYLFSKYPFISGDHFVDFGCGKGRTLIMASEYSCPLITGYEINSDIFCTLARNIDSYKKISKTSSKFTIFNDDAAKIILEDTTNKFNFYNPFHLKVYIKVVNSIAESVKRNPRKVYLFLYMPHRSTLQYIEQITDFHILESESTKEHYNLLLYAVLTNDYN